MKLPDHTKDTSVYGIRAAEMPLAARPNDIGRWPRRVIGFGVFILLLAAIFGAQFHLLVTSSLESDLNSYILLVPAVALYLILTQWSQLPRHYTTSFGWAIGPFVVGTAIIILFLTNGIESLSKNDHLGLMMVAFVCFLWTGGFLFLGKKWMAAAAFPIAFFIFLVPLPDHAVEWLERGLQLASAEAADLLFNLTGTPALRSGTVFELPGISLQVAQECSGVRSSWVLFITSLIAAYLFLRKTSSRLLLVSTVLPLGILRNGFRILVIGLLCVHVDHGMINSPIHRKGGPIFFVLSLIPLGLFLWFLRTREVSRDSSSKSETR